MSRGRYELAERLTGKRKLSRGTRSGRATDRNAVESSAAPSILNGEPTEGDRIAPAAHLAVVPVEASEPDRGTPEQQAAWQDLSNGWYLDRVLEAVARLGNVEDAAAVAGVNPVTVYRRQRDNPEFAAGLQLARKRFGQRALGKATAAFMNADPEQIVKTPTLGIAVVNWYNPELRPNAVAIDNRSVTVNVLSPEQTEAVARALAGVPDGEDLA